MAMGHPLHLKMQLLILLNCLLHTLLVEFRSRFFLPNCQINPHFSRGLLNNENSAGSLDLSDLLLHPGVWTGIWNSGMENGMENGMEQWIYTVTVNLCSGSIQSSLTMSLGQLSHCRGCLW